MQSLKESKRQKYISHEEFLSVNNVLAEYKEMEEEIKKIMKRLWNPLYKGGSYMHKNV